MMNKEKWFLYILRCRDNSLYTGISKNLEHRLKMHRNGKGAKYIKSRLPVELVFQKEVKDKSHALKMEIKIKKLSKLKKEELVKKSTICDTIDF